MASLVQYGPQVHAKTALAYLPVARAASLVASLTGVQVSAGKLAHVHVACTEFLTAMHTGGRSANDIDAGAVLPGYRGTIVRDGTAARSPALHRRPLATRRHQSRLNSYK